MVSLIVQDLTDLMWAPSHADVIIVINVMQLIFLYAYNGALWAYAYY